MIASAIISSINENPLRLCMIQLLQLWRRGLSGSPVLAKPPPTSGSQWVTGGADFTESGDALGACASPCACARNRTPATCSARMVPAEGFSRAICTVPHTPDPGDFCAGRYRHLAPLSASKSLTSSTVTCRIDSGLEVPSVCLDGIPTGRHAACMDQSLLPWQVLKEEDEWIRNMTRRGEGSLRRQPMRRP